MSLYYQPEVRHSLTQDEEDHLEAFARLLTGHMREVMLRRMNPFTSLDELYLIAKKEEMDVHLARLDTSKPFAVLREQIDHVAKLGLGVIDLSQGVFDYSTQAIIKQEVYA
ncbi:hypothetical protein [Pontibacter rugosus]|uniref:Uncharacterized protein n=1 Tax=Pontibacter rugosus TaxID=1745966 RepID=A0ABW3SJ76_9BACT